jgi:hypothetical protein
MGLTVEYDKYSGNTCGLGTVYEGLARSVHSSRLQLEVRRKRRKRTVTRRRHLLISHRQPEKDLSGWISSAIFMNCLFLLYSDSYTQGL